MSGLSVAGGTVSSSITGGDPNMGHVGGLSISAAANPFITVRLRSTLSSLAEFFFSSSVRPGIIHGNEVGFNLTGDSQFYVYNVYMAANGYWSGTIDQLRFDPPEGVGGQIEIDYIRLGSCPAGPPWEFNTDGCTEGWWVANCMSGLSVSGGALSTSITCHDPHIVNNDVQLAAAAFPHAVIRMRSTIGSDGEFFFSSTARPGLVTGNEVGFTIVGDNQWHIYSVDMSVNPYWSGTIDAFRLDPPDSGAVGTIEVDYIRLQAVPVPPTPEPTQTFTPQPTATGTPESCLHSGDVNNDGGITPGDAQTAFQYYLNCIALAPTMEQYCAADFCGGGTISPCDNSVTPGDAQGIMRQYLGFTMPCVKRSAAGGGGSLTLTQTPGREPGTVTVTVGLAGTEQPVSAFGIALTCGTAGAKLVGSQAGGLNPGWTMFKCAAAEPGMVRIGAWTSAGGLCAGQEGTLAELTFSLPADEQEIDIRLRSAEDDLAGFTVNHIELSAAADITPAIWETTK